jgi:hypothetical protein
MKNTSTTTWISQPQSKLAILTIFVCLLLQVLPSAALLKGTPGMEAGGGISISPADAKTMIGNYSNWDFNKNQKGGFLSKQAIDVMFPQGTNNNVIYWYTAAEIVGKDTILRLVVEPGYAVNAGLNSKADSKIFMSESMCPNECGSLSK